ncbi:helix-turn-helix transcriptional regulator [Paenibacillus algorifonticola]|uniref:helix-turn-helix domain-containing protein n=1 Tax=Paenibacillus algorifonticola TaxID=684063 RepID=UPI003D267DA4
MERKKLRELRKKSNISGAHLARSLGFNSSAGYFNIEYGLNKLSFEHATIIAKELGVNLDDLREDAENLDSF